MYYRRNVVLYEALAHSRAESALFFAVRRGNKSLFKHLTGQRNSSDFCDGGNGDTLLVFHVILIWFVWYILT